MANANVHVVSQPEKYKTVITASRHTLLGDEPLSEGGGDTGPNPYEYFLSSLGLCTAITLRMYADRKEWKLDKVTVELELNKTEAGNEIKRRVSVSGELDEEQKNRLLKIANSCPVHKILNTPLAIFTELS